MRTQKERLIMENEKLIQDTENKDTDKVFTQEEVTKLLQAEGDKRVTEALKKAEKKFMERLEEEKKKAAMDEQQKKEYELQRKQNELDQKIKELNMEKSKNEASHLLNDNKLPLDLLDFVVDEDSLAMKAKVESLAKVFNDSVNKAAEARLEGNNLKRGSDKQVASYTDEEWNKLSLAQKNEIYNTNREEYDSHYKKF